VCIPDQGATTASKPISGDTIIYAATDIYTGNFGGRSGANAICNNDMPQKLKDMRTAGKLTDITAFITVNPNDEIRDLHTIDNDGDGATGNFLSERPIYGYNSKWGTYTKLAVNWEDLLDGSILSSPYVALAYPSGAYWQVPDPLDFDYWTGSDIYGSFQASESYCPLSIGGCTCRQWTSDDPDDKGKEGNGFFSSIRWMSEVYGDTFVTCGIVDHMNGLLCVARYNE
jgi:hypothetical protein